MYIGLEKEDKITYTFLECVGRRKCHRMKLEPTTDVHVPHRKQVSESD